MSRRTEGEEQLILAPLITMSEDAFADCHPAAIDDGGIAQLHAELEAQRAARAEADHDRRRLVEALENSTALLEVSADAIKRLAFERDKLRVQLAECDLSFIDL